MEEIWKDVIGYEGLYQISSIGIVKSLSRIMFNGSGYFMSKEKILKLGSDTKGYNIVSLSKCGIVTAKLVHILVAESFLSHTPCGTTIVVNHKDFNRKNNNLSNLELITTRENTNKIHIPHTSRHTGVFWNKSKKKWQAHIVFKAKKIYLGRFDNEDDANEYYKNAITSIKKGEDIVCKKRKITSKHKGVSFNSRINKWVSNITFHGKYFHLGAFMDELDAHNAYQNKLIELKQLKK